MDTDIEEEFDPWAEEKPEVTPLRAAELKISDDKLKYMHTHKLTHLNTIHNPNARTTFLPRRSVTDEEVALWKKMWTDGSNFTEIARYVGKPVSTVWSYITGRSKNRHKGGRCDGRRFAISSGDVRKIEGAA